MKTKTIALLALTMGGASFAGEESISDSIPSDAPMAEERDWCDFFDLLGTPIYDSPGNPLVQEFKFYGRALETSRGWDTDAVTFWTAFRMYF